MSDDISLERLEERVLGRIALYRCRPNRAYIPTGVVLTVCALLAGVSAGYLRAHRYPAPGSESAVLAEDASLAPSTLLTTAP
jgi:hypothetical protein